VSPRARAAPVRGLAHVAIAVTEAEPVARLLEAAFGARRGEDEWIDEGTLRVLFLHLGSLTIELLEPKAGHTVAKFIERRGPGLHHVCFDVTDLDAALARSVEAGVTPIDARPRAGAHGARVVFLHPRSTAGVLIELRQPAAKRRAAARRDGRRFSQPPGAKRAGTRRR
jgi:methylmalonyl-CoA epimerase